MKNLGQTINPQLENLTNECSENVHSLILYNDDVNTFDYVIDCLIEICNHESNQAEQCAMITHYKGKCAIKDGEYKELDVMKNQLHSKGLSAVID